MSTTDHTGKIPHASQDKAGETAGATGDASPADTRPAKTSPAAARALAEAAERRAAADAEAARTTPQKEFKGRKGPDPIRYGDWEKNGIVSDF